MILNKSREIVEGATAYLISQRYRGWTEMASVMVFSDEAPRAIVAAELKRMRRHIRMQIARTERRRLKVERRAVGIHNRGVE